MSKELDCLNKKISDLEYRIAHPMEHQITPTIKIRLDDSAIYKEELETLKSIKERLEAIDNANPSEALKSLEKLSSFDVVVGKTKKYDISTTVGNYFRCEITTIKQALLKAQEHNSVNLLMQELDCKDFADLRKYARCGYEKINKKDLHLERVEE